MVSGSYLEIDLPAVEHNVRELRRELGGGTALIPVLKGNAYGLGATALARFFGSFGFIDTFAVSQVQEGLQLRQAGIEQQILVMSLPLDTQLRAAAEAGLTLTLGSFRQFPIMRELARELGRRISVSLKLDTGLHRIGFLPEEAERLCSCLKEAADWIEIRDSFSHFSEAGSEKTALEEERFRRYLDCLRAAGIQPGMCHIASSATVESGDGCSFDAVRIGRRLLMDAPLEPDGRIREAVSLRSFVTDIRTRRADEPLSYGGTVKLDRDTRVGVLSIGYGDGLEPALAQVRAPVLVHGRRARLLACCMDQSLIDLGEIPCETGDEVTLFGHDGEGGFLSAQEFAGMIGCEGCDLTVRLTPRVERIYRRD
ncbi:MAG: alanine racemase [Oscillospiraceae bacterium]|nr:alanine racemase [Oscillospiraceae bacterium]